ncbi:HAD hydrolase, family IA, variant 3 [Corynebacterium genitalium ATCC 33030]|uniref:HAD hydrolase, family IA, variant 3 n=1 Tax=Corynebacterium genitalium ATCC 33030 TaxID=585529 RepID=D7WCS1_9CORY|nr:HAD hydrolase, family IA, variant 3 [Corynebacterium genitalium ATCC 33030]
MFWDMDGTMVDTEPLWGIATYELSELLGRRLSAEKREETVGGAFANTLRVCAEWAGVELVDGDYDRYRSWMYQRMGELLAGDVEPNPGVRDFLASLKGAGMRMLVTTNTERELADYCIDIVGREFFVDSVTGDEVAQPKPAPDMYLRAAEIVGEDPVDCLVFEDSWAGMSAAATAGCVVLGLAEEVPEGVVRFDPAEFVGADAHDVSAWFSAARDRIK